MADLFSVDVDLIFYDTTSPPPFDGRRPTDATTAAKEGQAGGLPRRHVGVRDFPAFEPHVPQLERRERPGRPLALSNSPGIDWTPAIGFASLAASAPDTHMLTSSIRRFRSLRFLAGTAALFASGCGQRIESGARDSRRAQEGPRGRETRSRRGRLAFTGAGPAGHGSPSRSLRGPSRPSNRSLRL